MVFAKYCALFSFLMGPTSITIANSIAGHTKYEVNGGWVMKYQKHQEKKLLSPIITHPYPQQCAACLR